MRNDENLCKYRRASDDEGETQFQPTSLFSRINVVLCSRLFAK